MTSVVHAALLDDYNVSVNLISRIYHQRDQPEFNLGLCCIDKIPLDLIKDYYGKLTAISSLYLQYNQIRTLPPTFVSELSNIKLLDLGNNQLERLPEDFGNLEQLVYLDIHKNKLQSLPRSMGKMTRLIYLSLAHNPFGPPLHDIFELEKPTLNEDVIITHIAKLVVNFLAKIPPETLTIGSGDQSHSRRRAVTFENERETRKGTISKPEINLEIFASAPIVITEPEEDSMESVKTIESKSSFDTDLILGPFMPTKTGRKSSLRKQSQRQQSQVVFISTEDNWKWYKVHGAGILLIWLCMCPVMMALIFETSAVDQFVKEHDFLAFLWKAHRAIHEVTEHGINFLKVDNVIKVRGPERFPEYHDVDPFTAMFLAVKKSFADLFQNVVEFGH